MGQSVSSVAFTFVGEDEPHATRRKDILRKYPQMRELYGPDIRLLYSVMLLLALQFTMAAFAPSLPTWAFFLLAYSIGGTVTHALSLANHELSHNLCFQTPLFNELLGLIANLGHGVPSAITFKRYHLEHHYYQGHDGVDTDIPTELEGRLVNSMPRKIIWCFLQPLFYALRPPAVKPMSPKPMEIINFITTLAFDALVVKYFGGWSLAFLVCSTLLGMGLHPVAGHFIAEHYQVIHFQKSITITSILT